MGGTKETRRFHPPIRGPRGWECVPDLAPGLGAWNALDVIEKWRETNVPPDKIITSHRVDGAVDRTHPACPYPQAAIYKGSGDPDDAANFACGIPKW